MDLPEMDVLTVVLGTGTVPDMLGLMERVGLLPPGKGDAAAASAATSIVSPRGRERSSLEEILNSHGVAEICGAPIKNVGKLSWYQMGKYMTECYMRLMGKQMLKGID